MRYMPTVLVNGAVVHFRESGAGEGVLLLHSTSSSGAQWKSLMECMSSGYRLIAPDLFGYGRTDQWPGDSSDLILDEVAVASAMMDRFEGPMHVVGHSYGGHIAARAALAAPERVLSLTLIEPAMHYLLAQTGENQAYAEISSVATSVLALINSGEPEHAATIFLDYWVAPGALARMPPERSAAIVETMRKLAYEWPFSLARNDAPISEWRHLVTPTLLISGENTTFALRRLSALLRDVLPASDFVSIAGGGHMCPITHPNEVNAAITKHIERHRLASVA
jgi:pimeloyl-ACP methyl ester carboxylesterase